MVLERAPSPRPATAQLLVMALFATGCATHGSPRARSPDGTVAVPLPVAADDAGKTPGAPGGGEHAAGVSPSTTSPMASLPGGDEPTPAKALPELRVEPLGMHVGGGKNDAEEKAPFHRALERAFPAFLECYRLAEDPWFGGSFGIDLKIPRAGGAPLAEQPRTRIRGAGFQQCMVVAFANANFEKPKAGPTIISYSVVFTLGKAKR